MANLGNQTGAASTTANVLTANIQTGNISTTYSNTAGYATTTIVSYLYQYMAVAFANSATGGSGFTTVGPTLANYYGLYNTTANTVSSNPVDYSWFQVAGGFGTTKKLYFQTLGGRQVNFFIGSSAPDSTYNATVSNTPINLDNISASPTNQVIIASAYLLGNTQPATPSGGFYNFQTLTLTPPDQPVQWYANIPNITANTTAYISQAQFIGNLNSNVSPATTWTVPAAFAEGFSGNTGAQGQRGFVPMGYVVTATDPTSYTDAQYSTAFSSSRSNTTPPIGLGFPPIANDTAQFFWQASNPNNNVTIVKQYDGANWNTVVGTVISGNLFVTQSINASRLNANDIYAINVQSTNANIGNVASPGYWLQSNTGSASFAGTVTIGNNLTVGNNAVVGGNLTIVGLVNSGTLNANTVGTTQLQYNSVSSTQLQSQAVTQAKIANQAIGNAQVQLNSLNAATAIAAATITNAQIQTSTITGTLIAQNTITGNLVALNTITGNLVAQNTITGNLVVPYSIFGNAIIANTLNANSIQTNTFSANSIAGSTIVAGSITALQLAVNAITTNTITSYGQTIGTNTGTGFWLDGAQGSSTLGRAYFGNSVYINGALTVAGIATIGSGATFAGSLSGATGTFAGSLSAATGSFAGSLSAASGSFTGSLSGATGTFAGSLSAATGSFAGSLSAATGSFSGSLSGATGTFSGTVNAGNFVTSGGTIGTTYGTNAWIAGTSGSGYSAGDSWFGGTMTIGGKLVVNGTFTTSGVNVSQYIGAPATTAGLYVYNTGTTGGAAAFYNSTSGTFGLPTLFLSQGDTGPVLKAINSNAGGIGSVFSTNQNYAFVAARLGDTAPVAWFQGPIALSLSDSLGTAWALANPSSTINAAGGGYYLAGDGAWHPVSGITAGVSSFNTRTGAVTLTSGDVTGALGYTPSSTNGTVTSVSGTGSVNGLTLSGTVTTSGSLTLSGSVNIAASQVTSGVFDPARITASSGTNGVLYSNGTGTISTEQTLLTFADTNSGTATASAFRMNFLGSTSTGIAGAYIGTTGSGSTVTFAVQTTSPSDIRLKEEIADSDLGLDFVKKLRPVSYKLKADPIHQKGYGFIADEVEKLIPIGSSLVYEEPNWQVGDEIGFKTIHYPSYIAVLTKAAQEQADIIDRLIARIEALEAQINNH